MLSKKNVKRINMNGLYSHEPDSKYINYTENTVYHCKNWTFKPCKRNDVYYMKDTYWNDYNSNLIELTDDNFDEFVFVFDFNEVETFNGENIFEFEDNDHWIVAVDDGGKTLPKRYIRKGAKKNKEKVLARLKNELYMQRKTVEYMEKKIEDIENDTIGINELNFV